MPDSQQNNLEDFQSYCSNEGLEGSNNGTSLEKTSTVHLS